MSTNCTYCNPNNSIVYYPIYNAQCTTTTSGCSVAVDADCVTYTGPNLTSIEVDSNATLTEALTSINTTISAITGINWDEFDYSCLDAEDPITTAEEFAEAISAYVCALNTTVDTFIDTTYPAGIADLQGQITDLDEPGLTSCAAVNVLDTDTYSQILTKILTNLCSVNTQIDPSSAAWDTSHVVDPNPTTIVAAFNLVIGWIADLENNPPEAVLPQFDTRGTCLDDPQEADTLYDTLVKTYTKVCELPEFDIDDLTWQSCIANPNAGGGADLISTLNIILQRLQSAYSLRVTSFDSTYFTTSYTTVDNLCSGLVVTLRDDLGFSDRLVALDAGDADPDYLLNKITAGTNISFDTSTSPGEVIIDCDAEDKLVKANAADTSAGYLIDKIEGKADATNSIAIIESYNATTDKVDLTPAISIGSLFAEGMTAIMANTTLFAQFSAMVCAAQPCPDALPRTISGEIEIISGSDDAEFNVTFSQSTPTLAMYTSGDVVAAGGTILTTGAYTVTSSAIPVTGVLTVVNNNGGAVLPYNIFVVDENDDAVTGSTSQTGSITAGGTLTIDPLTYGSVTNMFLHVELGSALTTTTTTSTTTTTTTTL